MFSKSVFAALVCLLASSQTSAEPVWDPTLAEIGAELDTPDSKFSNLGPAIVEGAPTGLPKKGGRGEKKKGTNPWIWYGEKIKGRKN